MRRWLTTEQLIKKYHAIIGVAGIEIELCGTWLWVTGETRPVADVLKRNTFRWARRKQAWYFHTGSFSKRGRVMTLDEIRERHGSVRVGKGRAAFLVK